MTPDQRTETRLAGQTIANGRYELLENIGAGSFGVVYKARHVSLDQFVAVKILFQDVAAAYEGTAARFEREAKLASSLQHPNIVRVTDFGNDDGLLFLVMEYLEGRNLFDVLTDGDGLDLNELVEVMAQICGAMATAHDLGIVHRDLKPENVLLDCRKLDDGSTGQFVKVLDFGIAKVHIDDDSGTRPSLTGQGQIFGTPEYMSPEQARGAPLDCRSDIYAMGIILYQMVCGQTPFESAETPVGVLMRHISDVPAPPSHHVSDVPPELETLILKCIEKDPEDRFQTAREMRTALLSLFDGTDPRWRSLRMRNVGTLQTELDIHPTRLSQSPPPAFVDPVSDPVATLPSSPNRMAIVLVVVAFLLVAGAVALSLGNQPQPTETAPAARADDNSSTPTPDPADLSKSTAAAETPELPASPEDPSPSLAPSVGRAATLSEALTAQTPVFGAWGVALAQTSEDTDPEKRQRRRSGDRPDTTAEQNAEGGDKDPVVEEVVATNDTDPDKADPDKVDPDKANPDKVDPDKVDPKKVDPVKVDPKKVDPVEVAAVEPAPTFKAKVSVTSVGVKGALPKTLITRALEGERKDFEACYATASRSADKDLKHTLKVGFEINVDGWAGNVQVSKSKLPGLHACVKDVLSGVRLRERPDTGTVLAAARLVFTPETR